MYYEKQFDVVSIFSTNFRIDSAQILGDKYFFYIGKFMPYMCLFILNKWVALS